MGVVACGLDKILIIAEKVVEQWWKLSLRPKLVIFQCC